MRLNDWNIEQICGYKPITTFYTDFSIADRFGYGAIEDTYNRCKKHWCDNYKYLTELVMVLNWKIWEHYDSGNELFAKLYDELWKELSEYAMDNLKGDELSYYFRTTD